MRRVFRVVRCEMTQAEVCLGRKRVGRLGTSLAFRKNIFIDVWQGFPFCPGFLAFFVLSQQIHHVPLLLSSRTTLVPSPAHQPWMNRLEIALILGDSSSTGPDFPDVISFLILITLKTTSPPQWYPRRNLHSLPLSYPPWRIYQPTPIWKTGSRCPKRRKSTSPLPQKSTPPPQWSFHASRLASQPSQLARIGPRKPSPLSLPH